MDILRITTSGRRDEVRTELIPIAVDNLVCAICDAKCQDIEWTTVSHRKRKGVMVFSCEACIEKATQLLSKLL